MSSCGSTSTGSCCNGSVPSLVNLKVVGVGAGKGQVQEPAVLFGDFGEGFDDVFHVHPRRAPLAVDAYEMVPHLV